MEIFWRLVLGHFIADFTLQTNYIAAWKRRSVWGLLVHVGLHPAVYVLLLWNYLGQAWISVGGVSLTGWVCIGCIFTAHLAEDEWRIWSVQKQGAPDNTFFYLWDQVIHIAILFAFSPVTQGFFGGSGVLHFPPIQGIIPLEAAGELSVWSRFLNITVPEPWVWIGILFVVVTHFTTVFIYFIEKDRLGKEYPDTPEKYVSMAERLIVTGCFLLPGFWWVSVLLVWTFRAVLYKKRQVYESSWAGLAAGNGIAVLSGVIARAVLY